MIDLWYIQSCAGVVKLADALDSKSCGLIIRVGSSPTAGTNEQTTLQNNRKVVFSYSRTSACLHADCCVNMKKIRCEATCKVVCECRRRYFIPPRTFRFCRRRTRRCCAHSAYMRTDTVSLTRLTW